MKNKKRIFVIIGILILATIVYIFVINANKTKGFAYTFSATIVEIKDHETFIEVLIEGLKTNDINHRGKFRVSVGDKTEIVYRETKISKEDLNVGDNILVTYTNPEIIEISPAPLSGVTRIEIIEDDT